MGVNKKTFIVTALIGLLLVGGLGFGYYTMKLNQVVFRGIPIPVEKLDKELTRKWEKAFEDALADEEVLKVIVEKSDYATKLEVPADEAVASLKEAIEIKLNSQTLQVGFRGKRKYDEDMKSVAMVLYEVVYQVVASKDTSFREHVMALYQKSSEKSQE